MNLHDMNCMFETSQQGTIGLFCRINQTNYTFLYWSYDKGMYVINMVLSVKYVTWLNVIPSAHRMLLLGNRYYNPKDTCRGHCCIFSLRPPTTGIAMNNKYLFFFIQIMQFVNFYCCVSGSSFHSGHSFVYDVLDVLYFRLSVVPY